MLNQTPRGGNSVCIPHNHDDKSHDFRYAFGYKAPYRHVDIPSQFDDHGYATFVEGERIGTTSDRSMRHLSYSHEFPVNRTRELAFLAEASSETPNRNIEHHHDIVKYKNGTLSATLAPLISNGWSMDREA